MLCDWLLCDILTGSEHNSGQLLPCLVWRGRDPKLNFICLRFLPTDLQNVDSNSKSSKLEDDEELDEDEELQAVATHFGKELGELTLEALIKLEQKSPEEEESEERDAPQRKGPSLASILGTMPTSATLGLSESINNCIGNEKENGR